MTHQVQEILEKQMTRSLWTLTSLAAVTFGLVGCKVNPTDPSLADSADGSACKSQEAVIADGDDNNNQVNVIGGRGGYWYTFAEGASTDVWPTAGSKGGTFEMSPGGAENTPYGARFKGRIDPGEGNTLAGMGMNFLDPKGGYDASKYGGISFWAKTGAGSASSYRLKIPDINTDPDGGICSECFNDFGMNIEVTGEWQHFIIPFGDLKQLPGWGKPKKFGIQTSRLYGVQFQIDQKGAPFDLMVDQIRFTGCAGE